MVWIWRDAQDDWGAVFDGERSAPSLGLEAWSSTPVPAGSFNPVFISRASIQKFRSRHCPPMGGMPCVDGLWMRIILKFVPAYSIQFCPVRLIARGGESGDFNLIIPFDRVNCIDEAKSDFTSIVRQHDTTLYFGLNKVVHRGKCLGGLHMARDTIVTEHLVVSDALRNALAETGESSMFFRPKDLPLI